MSNSMFEDIKPMTRVSRRPLPKRPQSIKPPLPKEVPFEPKGPGRSLKYGLWYVAAACIVGLLFALSFIFEHATLTVVPKSVPVAFDTTDEFTAEKDSAEVGALVYTLMTLSGSETIKIPSTDSKTLSESAKGRALLYNEYSTSTYRLVQGTRLQSPDGRIYRIDSAASIPGYTKSGTKIIPGSLEVSVTAAVSGEAGNIENVDFTIPGLSGTAQASKIYARSKGSITGGVSGAVYTVSQSTADDAKETLESKLRSSLMAKAKVQIPDGYLFFDGATSFEIGKSVAVPYSKESEVPIVLEGTLYAYLIKEDTLTETIARRFASQYEGEPVYIPELSSLSFIPSREMDPSADQSFPFSLEGSTSVVWGIDKEILRAKLLGRKKADLETILEGDSAIERAEAVIKPFWKRSFPKTLKRISIKIDSL